MLGGKVVLQTWILSAYRKNFIEKLAESLEGRLYVYAGIPRKKDSVKVVNRLEHCKLMRGRNINIFSGWMYLCIQPGLIRWLEKQDPSVLVLTANPRFLMNWLAIRWMRRRGRRVISWGLWPPAPRGIFELFSKKIWKYYSNQFDRHIMYSHKHARDCIALGIPAEKVFVAPNSVLPTPPVWPDRKKTARTLKVLFVGRLEKRKKVDSLIRACARFHQEIELSIVGEGEEKNRLIELARSKSVNVNFHGAKFGKDLEKIFLEAEIFILPGTGGLAIQEALYYGLPVVVAEADGTQSDLINKKNGWQISSGDENAISEILAFAVQNKEHLIIMGREGWKIARDQVNMDIMLAGFLHALGKKRSFDAMTSDREIQCREFSL